MKKRDFIKAASVILTSTTLLSATGTFAQGFDRPIKIAISTAPDHPITIGGNKFAELIGQKSNGKLKARVYSGATLGSDVQVISSLQGGTVEAAVVTVGLLTSMVKEYNLLILPGVFHNVQEADVVLDGAYGTKLRDKLVEHRLIGLTYLEHGFKNISNSKHPIAKWEDVQGLKIRVSQTPSLVDAFTAIGANPVPMSFGEMYPALEQKAIDGMESTLVTFSSGKFNEVQKYMSLTQHIYDPLVLLFSKPVWDKMSEDQRKAVMDAAVAARGVQRQVTREREAQVVGELKSKGVAVTSMTDAEKNRMRDRFKPVVDKYRKEVGAAASDEFFAEVQKARTEVAARTSGSAMK